MDDETLTTGLAADLDGTFEALVCAYQDRLYAFGLRLTGSPRDAEEIAQDAFVRAYRALAREFIKRHGSPATVPALSHTPASESHET